MFCVEYLNKIIAPLLRTLRCYSLAKRDHCIQTLAVMSNLDENDKISCKLRARVGDEKIENDYFQGDIIISRDNISTPRRQDLHNCKLLGAVVAVKQGTAG